MRCPKCGRANEPDAVICGACDYILDTGFLGDDILDEGRAGEQTLGGDAVILGDLSGEYDSFFSEETGSFLSAATAEMARVVLPAEAYVDEPTRALLDNAAVPGLAEGVTLDDDVLSPLEQLVAGLVDGFRPLARIIRLSGLGDADVRIAVAMLAEKGVLVLAGRAESADVQSLDHTGDLTLHTGVDDDFDEKTHYDDALAGEIRARATGGFESPADTQVERGGNRYADLVGLRTREAANEVPGGAFGPEEALSDARTALEGGRLNRARMYAKIALSAGADPTVVDEVLAGVRARQAEARAPDDAEIAGLVTRAKEQETAGDYEGAVELLARAARLRPDLAPVHNQLGVVLAVRLKRFGESVEHLLRANEIDPARPAYRNNLGKVLARAAAAGWRPEANASPKVLELWSSWRRRLF